MYVASVLRFRSAGPAPGEFLKTGVWSWSRHPNYLGEMGFWWGLWLFGVAAAPAFWWTVVGPLGITLMFVFVSLPMIETRMKERRPAYAEYADGRTFGRSSGETAAILDERRARVLSTYAAILGALRLAGGGEGALRRVLDSFSGVELSKDESEAVSQVRVALDHGYDTALSMLVNAPKLPTRQ